MVSSYQETLLPITYTGSPIEVENKTKCFKKIKLKLKE